MFDVVKAISVSAVFSRSPYALGGDGEYPNVARGDEARIGTISQRELKKLVVAPKCKELYNNELDNNDA